MTPAGSVTLSDAELDAMVTAAMNGGLSEIAKDCMNVIDDARKRLPDCGVYGVVAMCVQQAFDMGYKAAGGTITRTTIADDQPALDYAPRAGYAARATVPREPTEKWPHTMDARVWAQEWLKTIAEHIHIPTDEGAMIGWFANAIMAGYDTAQQRAASVQPVPEPVADMDGARLRWLLDDHDDAEARRSAKNLLARMGVMTHSAATRDIDIAMRQHLSRVAGTASIQSSGTETPCESPPCTDTRLTSQSTDVAAANGQTDSPRIGRTVSAPLDPTGKRSDGLQHNPLVPRLRAGYATHEERCCVGCGEDAPDESCELAEACRLAADRIEGLERERAAWRRDAFKERERAETAEARAAQAAELLRDFVNGKPFDWPAARAFLAAKAGA